MKFVNHLKPSGYPAFLRMEHMKTSIGRTPLSLGMCVTSCAWEARVWGCVQWVTGAGGLHLRLRRSYRGSPSRAIAPPARSLAPFPHAPSPCSPSGRARRASRPQMPHAGCRSCCRGSKRACRRGTRCSRGPAGVRVWLSVGTVGAWWRARGCHGSLEASVHTLAPSTTPRHATPTHIQLLLGLREALPVHCVDEVHHGVHLREVTGPQLARRLVAAQVKRLEADIANDELLLTGVRRGLVGADLVVRQHVHQRRLARIV